MPAIYTIVLMILCSIATISNASENNPWRGAAGSVSITPEQSVWMAGYASRDKPSSGKIHDLHAKVLLLEDATGKRLAMVTLDLIGVTPELRSDVERRVSELGISAECLMLNASHTHCGPELRGERLVRFGIDPMYAALSNQYVRETAKKIGELIKTTIARLEPARLFYSHARAGFAMNRRLPSGSSFANSPNPDGPVDHDVPVLRLESIDKKLVAIVFGYACHNTTLSFNQLCGDYAGFAQEYVESNHEGTTAMFVNGCSADQNPYPRRNLELAQQHGRALANGVETALETKRFREVLGPLRCSLENVELRFAPPPSTDAIKAQLKSSDRFDRIHAEAMVEQLERWGSIPVSYDTFPIQAIQFGSDFTFVAICGEVVVDYALRLKRELQTSPESTIWVAGYSNYVFGYLPSLRVLKEGGYEGGGAMRYTTFPGPFDDSVEERVIGKVNELVRKVRKE